MATDGGGALHTSVGGLLMARDGNDVLATEFNACFIPSFRQKSYEQAIFHLSHIQGVITSH